MNRKRMITTMSVVLFLVVLWAGAYAQSEDYRSPVDQTLDSYERGPYVPSEGEEVIPPEPAEAPAEQGRVIEQPLPATPVAANKEIPLLNAEVKETPPAAEKSQEKPQSPAVSQKSLVLDVLELKDMEIVDVLKLISKKSGLNIVAGRDVRGKVTIYLKDVDVRDALRIILESNDMAYAEEDGILKVMAAKDYEMTYGHKFGEKTQIKIIQLKNANAAEVMALLNQMKSIVGKVIADEKSNTLVLMETPEKLSSMEALLKEIDVPIMSKVFELSYAQAEDLSKKIAEISTKNVGNVKFDARSNKIVVTDTPQKIEQIGSMIKAFDSKHQEVLIQAKIVQIILKDQYRLGVNWEAIVNNYHSLDLAGALSILNATDKRGKLSIGTLSSDDYTVLMEALDTVGTTNILSSPHIIAINNQEAKILVGSTEPYVTTTTTTPATGPTTTAESVNFIDVGVKLYVTPTIHKDNFITLKIKPEVSTVTSYLATSQNNKIPVVETSQAETTVLVKDGVTIVIGGLMKDEKVGTINKVPFLGDLPLLGFAFRNKDQMVKKTELVIFLTPKIMSGDVQTDTSLIDDFSKRKK